MTTTDLEQLRFPVGHFIKPETYSKEIIAKYIETISAFPTKLKDETSHLSDIQLDTTYRPNGWNIRQVVHHCADSHLNAFIRFKLTLTEDTPTIKPYMEDKWAELADSKTMSIEASLVLLYGLHKRWTVLLRSMTEEDFEKKFFHPEHKKEFILKESLGTYAWHCDHHLAHITELKKRENWK